MLYLDGAHNIFGEELQYEQRDEAKQQPRADNRSKDGKQRTRAATVL